MFDRKKCDGIAVRSLDASVARPLENNYLARARVDDVGRAFSNYLFTYYRLYLFKRC